MIDFERMSQILKIIRDWDSTTADPSSAYPDEFNDLIQMQNKLEPLLPILTDLRSRTVMRMMFLQGRSERTVAMAMGCNRSTVFRHRKRAIADLRSRFPDLIKA